MPRRKKNYKVGDWFLVPLDDGGNGLGIIAREDGGCVLGYFFPKVYSDRPPESKIRKLQPSDAILICRFSYLHLIKDTWTVIYHTDNFQPSDWPIPKFGNQDIVDPSRAYIVTYPDEKIGDIGDMREVKAEKIAGLPRDGLSGARSVELKLNRLLHPSIATE